MWLWATILNSAILDFNDFLSYSLGKKQKTNKTFEMYALLSGKIN